MAEEKGRKLPMNRTPHLDLMENKTEALVFTGSTCEACVHSSTQSQLWQSGPLPHRGMSGAVLLAHLAYQGCDWIFVDLESWTNVIRGGMICFPGRLGSVGGRGFVACQHVRTSQASPKGSKRTPGLVWNWTIDHENAAACTQHCHESGVYHISPSRIR